MKHIILHETFTKHMYTPGQTTLKAHTLKIKKSHTIGEKIFKF